MPSSTVTYRRMNGNNSLPSFSQPSGRRSVEEREQSVTAERYNSLVEAYKKQKAEIVVLKKALVSEQDKVQSL